MKTDDDDGRFVRACGFVSVRAGGLASERAGGRAGRDI